MVGQGCRESQEECWPRGVARLRVRMCYLEDRFGKQSVEGVHVQILRRREDMRVRTKKQARMECLFSSHGLYSPPRGPTYDHL